MGLWHRFQQAWNRRVFYPAVRFKYLCVTFRNHAEMLNKKARVEAQMHQCIAGKEPMPDKAKLREWANILGVPERFRREH